MCIMYIEKFEVSFWILVPVAGKVSMHTTCDISDLKYWDKLWSKTRPGPVTKPLPKLPLQIPTAPFLLIFNGFSTLGFGK